MHILSDFLIDTVAREETLNSERGYLFGLFFYLFLIQLDPSSARNLVRKAQFKKKLSCISVSVNYGSLKPQVFQKILFSLLSQHSNLI